MSLLMQFKFQPVTKYVRHTGTALYYYIVIPSRVTVHSRYELNARQDTRISFTSDACRVHDS